MAILDDMLLDSAPVEFEHRGQKYRVHYRPLAVDDLVKAKLDDMVRRFSQSDTGDFTGINPLMLDILADWDFDRIVRDDQDRPLAADGSVMTDRTAQMPRLEKLPITAETIARMPVFWKLDLATAIISDLTGSAGNTNGTSATTPAGGSSAAVPTPINGVGTSEPSPSLVTLPQTTVPPALVSVPSLESQRNTE